MTHLDHEQRRSSAEFSNQDLANRFRATNAELAMASAQRVIVTSEEATAQVIAEFGLEPKENRR